MAGLARALCMLLPLLAAGLALATAETPASAAAGGGGADSQPADPLASRPAAQQGPGAAAAAAAGGQGGAAGALQAAGAAPGGPGGDGGDAQFAQILERLPAFFAMGGQAVSLLVCGKHDCAPRGDCPEGQDCGAALVRDDGERPIRDLPGRVMAAATTAVQAVNVLNCGQLQCPDQSGGAAASARGAPAAVGGAAQAEL